MACNWYIISNFIICYGDGKIENVTTGQIKEVTITLPTTFNTYVTPIVTLNNGAWGQTHLKTISPTFSTIKVSAYAHDSVNPGNIVFYYVAIGK